MRHNSFMLPLVIIAFFAMLASNYCIWLYAPTEQIMGHVQRIFYVHLPLAWWGLISFFTVCVASIAYLKTRKWFWDNLAAAAAELGVLFAVLALVTGMIWGRISWGVWWTWDPRLSTTLVMCFVYAGYLLVRGMGLSRERRGMVSAVLGIIAFIDVPLVFFSARMWRSIHPAVFANKDGGLAPEMLYTLLVALAAMGVVWSIVLCLRTRQLSQLGRLDALAGSREE